MNVCTSHPDVAQQVVLLFHAHPVGWVHSFLIQQRLVQLLKL